jgi:hypothetical protein
MFHRIRNLVLAGISVVSIAVPGMVIADAAVAHAAAAPTSYTSDTGWQDTWDGGCRARSTATYYPASDQTVIATTVQSPYLFAACRVNAHVRVGTRNQEFDGATHYAMACAVTDPTCASTQTRDGTYQPSSPALTAYVESINATLGDLGLPPTATRQALVTGISISLSKAY